jgi:hypothetical protein
LISAIKDEIRITPRASQWRRAFIVGPGFLLALIIMGLSIAEWIRIGVIANPQEIEKYYFGSEAMMGHGGWKYVSASAYTWSVFGEGLFAGMIGAAFIYGFLRYSKKAIVIAYFGLALLVAYLRFL